MPPQERESADERVLRKRSKYVASVPNAHVVAVATNSGMLALWRGSAFAEVDGYAAWEARVNDRLGDAIQFGELVPVGIQSDGAFGVRVAIAPDGATEREIRYTVVTSEPYLLVADGGPVMLSGIEVVGDQQSSPITLSLPEGRYAVRASIVAWDDEPGARDPNGLPGPNALADFLVAITPSDGHESFRTSDITFDQPN